MSSNEFPDLNLLYTLALAEVQNTEIQQLKPNFYGTLSQFLGKLKIEEYDGRVFKTAPISEDKQRHVNLYGVAERGTWSENISRQLSVPERDNFKSWLKSHGFNLE